VKGWTCWAWTSGSCQPAPLSTACTAASQVHQSFVGTFSMTGRQSAVRTWHGRIAPSACQCLNIVGLSSCPKEACWCTGAWRLPPLCCLLCMCCLCELLSRTLTCILTSVSPSSCQPTHAPMPWPATSRNLKFPLGFLMGSSLNTSPFCRRCVGRFWRQT